jgi:hypothetical protein
VTLTRRALGPGETDHERLWLAIGAGLLLFGACVQAGLAPRLVCPLKLATGLPCIGCGATRALAALVSGHVAEALRANPLAGAVAVAWASWALHAIAVLATGARRLRVTLSAHDLTVMRWTAGAAVACTWVFLILDGR